MHPRSPVAGTLSCVLPFVFAPLLGACEGRDEPVVEQATCAIVEEASLPGPVEVVAVDRGGRVHVASSSSYWVLHVAARGDELVVAHAGDGNPCGARLRRRVDHVLLTTCRAMLREPVRRADGRHG
jgi:hypothetical protein